MTDIADYLDHHFDGATTARRLLQSMRDLDLADAVIAQWAEASSSIAIVRVDGSMSTTGRQSADYSHRSWAARDGEETDGVVSIWWEHGVWCLSIEDHETEVVVHPPQDEDDEEAAA